MRAAFGDLLELEFLVVIKGARIAQQPVGHVADLGRRGPGRRGRAQFPERLHVVADGAVAAAVSLRLDLCVQGERASTAFVPPLVQVGLVLSQQRRSAAAGLAQQLPDAAV